MMKKLTSALESDTFLSFASRDTKYYWLFQFRGTGIHLRGKVAVFVTGIRKICRCVCFYKFAIVCPVCLSLDKNLLHCANTSEISQVTTILPIDNIIRYNRQLRSDYSYATFGYAYIHLTLLPHRISMTDSLRTCMKLNFHYRKIFMQPLHFQY